MVFYFRDAPGDVEGTAGLKRREENAAIPLFFSSLSSHVLSCVFEVFPHQCAVYDAFRRKAHIRFGSFVSDGVKGCLSALNNAESSLSCSKIPYFTSVILTRFFMFALTS